MKLSEQGQTELNKSFFRISWNLQKILQKYSGALRTPSNIYESFFADRNVLINLLVKVIFHQLVEYLFKLNGEVKTNCVVFFIINNEDLRTASVDPFQSFLLILDKKNTPHQFYITFYAFVRFNIEVSESFFFLFCLGKTFKSHITWNIPVSFCKYFLHILCIQKPKIRKLVGTLFIVSFIDPCKCSASQLAHFVPHFISFYTP